MRLSTSRAGRRVPQNSNSKTVKQSRAIVRASYWVESLESRLLLSNHATGTGAAGSGNVASVQQIQSSSVVINPSDSTATNVFVDFHNTPPLPTGPSTFGAAGPEQDIVVSGVATFEGGVVLGNPTFFPAESYATAPNVYGTASPSVAFDADPSLQPILTISVNSSFTANQISFPLFNGNAIPVTYVVDAYSGATPVGSQTFTNVPANLQSGFVVVDIKEPNITSMTITAADASTDGWDFLIDSVSFNESVQQEVPIFSTTPGIAGVIFSGSGQNTTITIEGSGFGYSPTSVPTTGDIDYLELQDFGGSGGDTPLFVAGGSHFGASSDPVTLDYESWTNNQIVIGGFGGSYGENGAVINPGDKIGVTVWNTADTDATGPSGSWQGSNPILPATPPAPQNAPSLLDLPTEPQLWDPEPNTLSDLEDDETINTFVDNNIDPTISGEEFVQNPSSSQGWKAVFSDAESFTSDVGTAAGLVGDITSGDAAGFAYDSAKWALEQTPQYQQLRVAQVVDMAGSDVQDSISLAINCGLAGATAGTDVVNDGGCILSAIGVVSGDILSPIFGYLAQDPPDPNYTQVFTPELVATEPLTPPTAIPTNVGQSMVQTASDLDQTMIYLDAVEVTANRYGFALAANDLRSAGMQYVAFINYLGTYNIDAAKSSADLSQLASLMESNDIGTNIPTAGELSQMENDLATEGAAIPGLFQYFETLGFTDTQIRTMVQQALANPPTLPTESVDQAMQDLSNLLKSVSVPVPSIVAEPPTAVGHNYSLSENSSIIVPAAQGLLANAADPNSLQLIATDFSEPAHGTLQANSDGSFTYTPDSGYSGLDSFTFEAGDGVFLSQPATVSLTITPLESLVFTQEPSNTTAGKGIAPAVTVAIENLQGITLTTDNSDITLSVYSGPGILNGTTSVQAKNGVATFKNLTLDIAGTYTLVASDASDSLSVNSTSFDITPTAAAKLAFIQQPTNTTAGNIISPAVTVAVEDQFGNIVTTNNSCVTLALASDPPCNPRLNVTLTAQVRDGVATFNNLLLTAAGTYTFKATDGRLTSVTSSSFQITPAAAVRMVFIESPWLNEPGKKFHVEVELLDKYGNVATNNTSEVTLSLGLHPRGAALSGTMTANVVNGIATFENLSINKLGFYTLFASDSNTGLPVAVIPLLMI